MIDSRLARSAFALSAVFVMAGCSYLPKISTAPSNWPLSAGMTPEETRAKREAEVAIYMEKKPVKEEAKAPSPSAAATASAVTTNAGARRFEVAPDLIRQTPPAPARQMAAVVPASRADVPNASRHGDLFFISGQLPVDARGNPSPADSRIEDQARLALENVRSVLEANKLTMANVVSMTVYLKDLNDLRAFDAVYASYFKGAQPARSVVEISRLPQNAKIEISAVAGR